MEFISDLWLVGLLTGIIWAFAAHSAEEAHLLRLVGSSEYARLRLTAEARSQLAGPSAIWRLRQLMGGICAVGATISAALTLAVGVVPAVISSRWPVAGSRLSYVLMLAGFAAAFMLQVTLQSALQKGLTEPDAL